MSRDHQSCSRHTWHICVHNNRSRWFHLSRRPAVVSCTKFGLPLPILMPLSAGVCWYVLHLRLSWISQVNIHSHKVSSYTGGVSLSLYLLPVTNPFSESGRDPRTIVRFPLVSAYRLSDSLWIHSVWIIRLRTLRQSPKRAEIAKVMVSPFRSVVRRLIDVFLSKFRYLSRQVSRWETLRYTS